jgi:hypothetical protein
MGPRVLPISAGMRRWGLPFRPVNTGREMRQEAQVSLFPSVVAQAAWSLSPVGGGINTLGTVGARPASVVMAAFRNMGNRH